MKVFVSASSRYENKLGTLSPHEGTVNTASPSWLIRMFSSSLNLTPATQHGKASFQLLLFVIEFHTGLVSNSGMGWPWLGKRKHNVWWWYFSWELDCSVFSSLLPFSFVLCLWKVQQQGDELRDCMILFSPACCTNSRAGGWKRSPAASCGLFSLHPPDTLNQTQINTNSWHPLLIGLAQC